ncbi:MAG TPA: NAD(P)H-dependent glycerol-3-phosphate dehydrogenase [Candidatus Methylacidiphilales bacterium]
MKVGILGAGKWGTAMAEVLKRNGHETAFRHHGDAAQGWPEGIDFLVLAIPVQAMRATLQAFPAPGVPVLSLSKGLEVGTGRRVSEIVAEVWPGAEAGALSGPNFASEIAAGLPAAAVVAAESAALAERFQNLIHHRSFRLYRSTDLRGVELGGALKNVYAIAAGLCVGMKLGHNAYAALLTRCLAEMARTGVRLGGKAETFAGLSGVGDLLLTSGSEMSRNYRVGHLLSQGRDLASILAEVGVAEGVETARSLYGLAAVPADAKPVACQVHAILFEGVPPRQAVAELMERAAAPEVRDY